MSVNMHGGIMCGVWSLCVCVCVCVCVWNHAETNNRMINVYRMDKNIPFKYFLIGSLKEIANQKMNICLKCILP